MMKRVLKRITSLILVLSLLSSLVAFPTYAVDSGVTVTFGFANYKYDDQTKTYSIDITLSGSTEKFNITNAQINVSFDQTVIQLKSRKMGNIPMGTNDDGDELPMQFTCNTNGSNLIGDAILVYTSQANAHEITSGMTVATLVFENAEGAESGKTTLSFDVSKAGKDGSNVAGLPLGVSHTVNDEATFEFDVVGGAPTIQTVTLDNAGPVTVSGGDIAAQTIQATATSAKGNNITNKVAWSVFPAGQGVTVDPASGLVSVGAKAVAGEYTVKADGKSEQDEIGRASCRERV